MARWRYRSGCVAAHAAAMQRSGRMSNLSEYVRLDHGHAGMRAGWLLLTVRIWIARSRQRKALGDLAECNAHLLKDIGLSDEQARREAAKWFWQT
jgi:uncharacterized protein YjiS (DUF1127 family)